MRDMTEVSLFDYELPEELIAVRPARRRGESRLLCLGRRSGAVEHRSFADVEDLLRPDDVLVVNDARVIPARLSARRATGGRVEVLLVRPAESSAETPGDAWTALLRPGGRVRPGEVLDLERSGAKLLLRRRLGRGRWLVSAQGAALSMEQLLADGSMPLPPYILKARRRRGMPADLPDLDARRYQTVYARHPGAVAAPTAGLHFTAAMLRRLQEKGVTVRPLTLMVGPGTFQPVRSASVEGHQLAPESYRLPQGTASAVAAALAEGRRVVATGTTCCRVLEHVARLDDWGEQSGWTDLYIHPPFEFRAVGALITNFHLPRSTLLMLVCAFAGRERVLEAYRIAVRERYRFYSYGDAMLIH